MTKRAEHLKLQKTQLTVMAGRVKNSFVAVPAAATYIFNYLKSAHEKREDVHYTPAALLYLRQIQEVLNSIKVPCEKLISSCEMLNDIITLAESKVPQVEAEPKTSTKAALESRVAELESQIKSLTKQPAKASV